MPLDQTNSKAQVQASSSEHKARGANRSTKVAGKLKVLPEQPDLPTLVGSNGVAKHHGPPRDREESVGTTGDSDEGDMDDDEDEPEVEVSCRLVV